MQHPPHDIDASPLEAIRAVEDLETAGTDRDAGATLFELVVVIAILGLLIGAVLVGLSGMKSQAAGSTCAVDDRHLSAAVESYFAANGTRTVSVTGIGPDRFERTLVDGGFLRHVSQFHDIDANGVSSTKAGTSC